MLPLPDSWQLVLVPSLKQTARPFESGCAADREAQVPTRLAGGRRISPVGYDLRAITGAPEKAAMRCGLLLQRPT